MPLQAPPLTHHAILALVEPFTRRGHHVDLAASRRLERKLVFKAVEHAGGTANGGWCESLRLDEVEPGCWRLTRALQWGDGLEAHLQTEGADPGELLGRMQAVSPQGQFRRDAGFAIAHHQRLDVSARGTRTVLMRSELRVAGLALTLKVPRVSGMPGSIELSAAEGDGLELPADLLAVLGLDWARLDRVRTGWHGSLRLRANEPERSRDAEAKLARTAQHLARTMAEPPGRFHDRFAGARWGVALRRAVPLLACIALIAGAAAVPRLGLAEHSVFKMLILNAPPLLLVFFFALREIPRIEIPPLPRRSAAPAWRRAPLE